MTEREAINKIYEILDRKPLQKTDIDDFFALEEYISDYKFGDLYDTLMALCPRELLRYL